LLIADRAEERSVAERSRSLATEEAKMAWTNERIELLHRLWLAGRSAAEISQELGPDISRNAVIGKVSRLGLTDQSRAPAARAKRRSAEATNAPRYRGPAREGSAARPRRHAFAGDGKQHLGTIRDFGRTIAAPLARCVALDELDADMCRWPLGEPLSHEFRFCGAQTVPKRSYCSCHLRAAYRPESRPRNQDQRQPSKSGRRLEFC
jgi:GcrA cell cycle regulator